MRWGGRRDLETGADRREREEEDEKESSKTKERNTEKAAVCLCWGMVREGGRGTNYNLQI